MADLDPNQPAKPNPDDTPKMPVDPQTQPDAPKPADPYTLSSVPTPAIPPPVEPITPPPPPPAPAATPVPVSKPPAKVQPQSRDVLSKFRNKLVEEEGSPMSFIDHLMELRKRLWISIIACVLSIVLAVVFFEDIYKLLTGPIRNINADLAGPAGDKYREMGSLEAGKDAVILATTQPLANMMLVLWMGFWGGMVVASPLVLYQVWAFVAPGLKPSEKRAIMPVLYGGLAFFLGGIFICYKWMIPPSLKFFITLDLQLKTKINWTAETTIDLMLWMMIISGLLCEIPLIVAAMAKMDVIRASSLIRHWRGMIFGSILIGAIVSPGNDLASMGVFAGLMLGIYFVSIFMAWLFQARQPKDKNKKKKKDDIDKT